MDATSHVYDGKNPEDRGVSVTLDGVEALGARPAAVRRRAGWNATSADVAGRLVQQANVRWWYAPREQAEAEARAREATRIAEERAQWTGWADGDLRAEYARRDAAAVRARLEADMAQTEANSLAMKADAARDHAEDVADEQVRRDEERGVHVTEEDGDVYGHCAGPFPCGHG